MYSNYGIQKAQMGLTGVSKELREEILPRLIAEEVRVSREQHRRRGPAHVDTLLVGRLVLEVILVIVLPWREKHAHEI